MMVEIENFSVCFNIVDPQAAYIPTGPATPLKRAPAWLKRPAGVAFGFGNRLVSFKNVGRQGQSGEHVDAGLVTVTHVSLTNVC